MPFVDIAADAALALGLDPFAFELAGREVGRPLAHAQAPSRAQQKGRDEIFADYHLRVGQITADNQLPTGYALKEQRLDETEVGEGTTVTLINATRPPSGSRPTIRTIASSGLA